MCWQNTPNKPRKGVIIINDDDYSELNSKFHMGLLRHSLLKASHRYKKYTEHSRRVTNARSKRMGNRHHFCTLMIGLLFEPHIHLKERKNDDDHHDAFALEATLEVG